MWRKVATPQTTAHPVEGRTLQPTAPMPLPELAQLLLPRPPRTRTLRSLLFFWAPTSPGSTTRAACFFQHVSATTWLRAS